MRILIADDDAQVRFALRVLLQKRLGMEVVGEVTSMDGLKTQLAENQPDVLLMDWELPGLSAQKVLPALHQSHPTLVVIGMSSRLEARGAALGAGVDGFVSKTDGPEYLLRAMEDAVRRR